ncbi:MAG: MarR family transcriptional regulator [Sphingobacteriaceae bacterium]|nr:MarR family transcriptional regulator [Sphingobacteriaceae bacterium]
MEKIKSELYTFLTGQASTALGRRLQRNLKNENLDISIEQWSLLYRLWQNDGQTQQQLCESTFRDKPSITRLIDNLEKQNLVLRVADENDRRINRIFLNEKAKDIQAKSLTAADQTLSEALENVTDHDLEVCKAVLTKVLSNLK